MYFWTPHWAQQKYDLTMVKLPDVTPACEQAAASTPTQYACAYPQDDLYKAFNQDLQTKAPAAYAFLSAMQYTNDDQNIIGLGITQQGRPRRRRRSSGSTTTPRCGSPGSMPDWRPVLIRSSIQRTEHGETGAVAGRRPSRYALSPGCCQRN